MTKEENKERQRIFRKNHPGYYLKYNKKYYMKNKWNPESSCYINNLGFKLGLTVEDYNNMFNLQEGRCLICKKHQSEFKRALCIDHDHNTDKIRGLICHKCNFLISNANDDIEILKNAISYLENNTSIK